LEEQLYSFLIFVVVLICIVFDFVRVENGTKIIFFSIKNPLGSLCIAWFIRKNEGTRVHPSGHIAFDCGYALCIDSCDDSFD